jgi:transposase, IS5 family
MLITTNPQLTLWETVLPPGYQDLPKQLAAVDALLDDPVFFQPYRAHFSADFGRPSIPIETYLRMMFLKHHYRLGYETLCREVADSLSWSRFCRVPLGCTVPHPSTLEKITTRCGPETIAQLNRALLVKAGAAKVVRLDKVRADTTVVAANVAYPTDSGLLVRAITLLTMLVALIHTAGGAARTTVRDRRRTAGRRARSISAHLKLRNDEAKTRVLAITGELADLAEATAGEASKVLVNARRGIAHHGGQACGRLVAAVTELEIILGRTGQVITQTRSRLGGVMPASATRLVSLHDPDARAIAKGRLGKPVEFGYKGQVVDNVDGIVLDHSVHLRQPARRAAAGPRDRPHPEPVRPGGPRGDRGPRLRRSEDRPRAARPRRQDGGDPPQGQALSRPPRTRARARVPAAGQVAHRIRGPHLLPQAPLRLGPHPVRHPGEPPRFRIPDPIRSGPERRMIYARTA